MLQITKTKSDNKKNLVTKPIADIRYKRAISDIKAASKKELSHTGWRLHRILHLVTDLKELKFADNEKRSITTEIERLCMAINESIGKHNGVDVFEKNGRKIFFEKYGKVTYDSKRKSVNLNGFTLINY